MNVTIDQTRLWRLAHGRSLELVRQAQLMGVLNVTPDSFSDGGQYTSLDAVLRQAERLVEEGASIIDVGGESTRPGSAPVSPEEERNRVVPAIKAIAERFNVLLSIDTYRAETAQAAVDAGAHIVNDVWGLQREPDLAGVAARNGAGLVIMHTNRGGRPILPDVIEDQVGFLQRSLKIAHEAGVTNEQIVLDPGFGFGKETLAMNLSLMRRVAELKALGFPLLVGTSRKRFLGTITGREPAERDAATAATSVILRMAGAVLFRVHDVAMNRDALAVVDAMLQAEPRL
ncbi:dihydropteroate synthase [Tianweitania populi]|uniref:Dihydropteroate synthase n=1 Tax=Tianweitania populi TaxID=1607949 RepID=A0A8J3DNJ1_9HYPH|nr:dihydropteroate synthase [Tianweitania populi]GHD10049.1 dihydropteroate synthase [Tianweitania populi]